jgi:hypothetical protein
MCPFQAFSTFEDLIDGFHPWKNRKKLKSSEVQNTPMEFQLKDVGVSLINLKYFPKYCSLPALTVFGKTATQLFYTEVLKEHSAEYECF